MIDIRQTCSGDFGDLMVLLEQLWPDQRLDARALNTVFSKALECRHQQADQHMPVEVEAQ